VVGLLLPFGQGFAQLSCDAPPVNRSGDLVKYLNRKGAKQRPATFGDGESSMATEGWNDALCLYLATGATVQTLQGVASTKLLAPSVGLLIYYADVATNPVVRGQLIRASLERRTLRLAFFPAETAAAKGCACQFFVKGGELSTVPRRGASELPRQWDRTLRVDWQAPAISRLAVQAGLSRDAANQVLESGAK